MDGAVAVLFPQIDLELAFGAVHAPLVIVAARAGAPVHFLPRQIPLQIEISEDHAAKVRDMADSAAACAKRAEEGDGSHDHHEILCFNREQEAKQDNAVWIEKT